MDRTKKAALTTMKVLFCLFLSWALILITLGYVLFYFDVSFPIGILAPPAAYFMFSFFSTLEKPHSK